MRVFLNWIVLVLFVFLMNACLPKERAIEPRNVFTALKTQSIPLKIRENQFSKGNLVINGSFEEGKYLLEKTDDPMANIKGWTRSASNVEWTDPESGLFHENEVYEGMHSVKITRIKANETDEPGDGVESDFIKVLQGNYDFTYYIRLKDILPQAERIGTRIHDAINIRLYFYDKHKVRIDGKQFYPYKEILLDSEFKGYSFSNFRDIDSLGWGKIQARTYNYPLSEGDIPDGTQFIKIFIGLKGTGTMWVDKLDFRYSKWNFTALERMSPYFDTSFSVASMLIPTPKKMDTNAVVPLFQLKHDSYIPPLILIPASANKQTILAAKLVKEELMNRQERYFKGEALEGVKISPGMIPPEDFDGLIFSIGKTSVFEKWKDSLLYSSIQDKEQSYIIEPLPGKSNLVFIAGRDPIGDYYGATSLVQLMDKDTNLYHSATILDFPDITGRSYLFASWNNQEELIEDIGSIDRMSRLKFNKAYVGYGQTRGRKNWYAPDNLYINGVSLAGRKCRELGVVNLAIMVNPYYHFDYEMHIDSISSDLKNQFVHSHASSLQKLKNVFQIGLDAEANTIMLMGDDFVPHSGSNRKSYTLYHKDDIDKFGSLQNAQGYMINNLYDWLKQNYSNTRFEFCPPWYLNEFIDRSRGQAEVYFNDLMKTIPTDVAIVWTGNTVRSLTYDLADFERYTRLIGRSPMIWDNTLYARGLEGVYGGYPAYYPGKAKLCNLFEPYDVQLPENFEKYIDGPHMYVNGSAYSEIYKIKYATVADFEWNTRDYNPEFSLWKALNSEYGVQVSKLLLEFSDIYYAMIEIDYLLEEDADQRTINLGKKLLENMEQIYSLLQSEPNMNLKLLAELEVYKIKAETKIKSFTNVIQ